MERIWIRLGAFVCFVGVALGAFAAHGLRHRLSVEALSIFEVGVRYQMLHGLALLLLAGLDRQISTGLGRWTGLSFFFGITVFSGSLYALALTGQRWWGAVTPIGGVAFLLGWGLLFFSACRNKCGGAKGED